jgi:hypothetical protein
VQLNIRPLTAACSPLKSGDFTTGPQAEEFPLDCIGRGVDSAGDCGPGDGRQLAGSNEPPGSNESNSLALRLPALVCGDTAGGRRLSHTRRAGLPPTDQSSESFARPSCLGEGLGFPPRRLCSSSAVVWKPGIARPDGHEERAIPPPLSCWKKSLNSKQFFKPQSENH